MVLKACLFKPGPGSMSRDESFFFFGPRVEDSSYSRWRVRSGQFTMIMGVEWAAPNQKNTSLMGMASPKDLVDTVGIESIEPIQY
jgi:hypothetical protein